MASQYYSEILNYFTGVMRDREAAADIVQEAYARLLALQQAGQAVTEPRALLYRTARNLVIDRHRRLQVRGEAASDGEEILENLPAATASEPDARLDSTQRLAAVTDVIDRLPPRCREAFILYKFDGLSCAEVARHMGISARTVEMQLQKAMAACWRCLDELDGE